MNKKKLFVLKILTWRIVSIIVMMSTIQLLTGSFAFAGKLTILVQFIQTIAHAIFEKLWRSVEK